LEVMDDRLFEGPHDYLALIPPEVSETFTNQELADGLQMPRSLAAKMTYCLRRMGLLEQVGKVGRFNLYESKGGQLFP
jgi:DNA-binding IclR family transcriptional regulator